MGRLEDLGRYYILRNARAERAAHRLELMVRSSMQRRTIAQIGRTGVAHMGESTVSLDLTVLREFLMYRSLTEGGGYGYEPGSTRVILNALEPGSLFMDVGANIGYFTLIALGRLSAPGAIIAIEPNPGTFRRLCRIVGPHDPHHLVRLVNAAATDSEGSAMLFHSPVDDARDSLTPVGPDSVEVRTLRLDSFDVAGKHVVVKIDAEGAEERVLSGMDGVIDSAASLSIVLEWNPPLAGPALWQKIHERFRAHRIDERNPGRVVEISSIAEIRTRLTNLWLVRRPKRPVGS